MSDQSIDLSTDGLTEERERLESEDFQLDLPAPGPRSRQAEDPDAISEAQEAGDWGGSFAHKTADLAHPEDELRQAGDGNQEAASDAASEGRWEDSFAHKVGDLIYVDSGNDSDDNDDREDDQ